MPSKAARAMRWCSGSTSIEVSTPSGRMPRSNHRPERPVPVPTSTTARAVTADARKRSAEPTPAEIGTHAEHAAGGARIGHHVVLREVGVDEIGGIGAVHGRKGY